MGLRVKTETNTPPISLSLKGPKCPNCGINVGEEELAFYGGVCEKCYYFSGFNHEAGGM